MVSLEAFSNLLEPLYEGLLCPDRWRDFVSDLREILECDVVSLTFHDANEAPVILSAAGLSEDAANEWMAHFGSRKSTAFGG
jgi:hypothetical protein